VPTRDILAELPDLATEITSGTFQIDARPVPLTDIETAWKDTDGNQRIVITPRYSRRPDVVRPCQ